MKRSYSKTYSIIDMNHAIPRIFPINEEEKYVNGNS